MFEAHVKPLFEKTEPTKTDTIKTKGKLKSQQAIEKTREALQKDLMRNTRAAIDPFLAHQDRPRPALGIKINKRKARHIISETKIDEIGITTRVGEEGGKKTRELLGLDYSSD